MMCVLRSDQIFLIWCFGQVELRSHRCYSQLNFIVRFNLQDVDNEISTTLGGRISLCLLVPDHYNLLLNLEFDKTRCPYTTPRTDLEFVSVFLFYIRKVKPYFALFRYMYFMCTNKYEINFVRNINQNLSNPNEYRLSMYIVNNVSACYIQMC